MDFAFKLPFRDTALPVQVEQSTWTHIDDGRAIIKTFQFDRFQEFHTFTSHVLKHLRSERHDADINIRGVSITIKLTTSVINDVTERDLEIARYCDELREDVRYYYGEKRAV